MTTAASGTDLEARQLRDVFGRFATGVALVGAHVQGRPVGILTNSFTSISLDPPLVALSFARTSTSWPLLQHASQWGISVLGQHQEQDMAHLTRPAMNRFDGLDWRADEEGALFLGRAIATISVRPQQEIDAGDHILTLLRVTAAHTHGVENPLIFHRSQTRRLAGRGPTPQPRGRDQS